MLWGCMSASGVGEMILCEGRMNSNRYISMLQEVLEPSIEKLFEDDGDNYFYQQDNAPCHRAQATMRWFTSNGVRLLDWPAQSPDLSPIEHLWYILKRNIGRYHYTSKHELQQKIKEEWQCITKELCYKLVATMPKRIKAVIKAHGGSTKY